MTEPYRAAGVDYDALDREKRNALAAAASTSSFALARGARFADDSRGEPAAVFELAGRHFAFVLECLGTKSMLARAYEELTGEDHFDQAAYDTVAAVVNDCCCPGALPLVVNAYFATAAADFFAGSRGESLVQGWRRACVDAAATWGGGESPSLGGLIVDGQIDLAGSAIGILPEGRSPLLGAELVAGDEIVLVASSGLHANGASLVRHVLSRLPDGLVTTLASGVTLGEAVLTESVIYVGLIDALYREDVPLHYVTHLSGHGWRKLMRPARELSYRISELPVVPEILAFLVDALEMTPAHAYGTFNMGAGFALYVPEGAGARAVAVAKHAGYDALCAGRVEDGARRVVIEPLDVSFGSEELELR